MVWKSPARTLLALTLLVLAPGATVVLAGSANAVLPDAPSLQIGVVGFGRVSVGGTPACQAPQTNGGISTAGSGTQHDCAAFDPSSSEHCTSTDNGDGTSSSSCTVTLTASVIEAGGWSFDHWSGDCSGTATTCTVSVEESDCDTRLHPPCHSTYETVAAVAHFRDTRTPTTTITSGPADHAVAWSQAQSATFGFGSDEAGEITSSQCRHDDGSWQSCSSPATWGSIADGVHSFCVRQYDGSGLASVPSCRTWEQEVPISLSIAASPAGVVTDANTLMTFQFGTNKVHGEYRCGVDGAVLGPCPNPGHAMALANGTHTMHLVYRFTPSTGFGDPVDSQPATYTWSQSDTTAPHVAFGLPSNQVVTTTPALSYAIDDPQAEVTCRVDGTPVSCDRTRATLPATTGVHTLLLHVEDRLGNAGDFTWTWERRAPVLAPATTCTVRLATRLRHHRARFTARCDSAGAGSLDATVKVGRRTRRLAAGSVQVSANHDLKLTLRIPNGTWKRLKHSHRYRATASLAVGAAQAVATTRVHR